MAATYKAEVVTVLRPVSSGEPNFVEDGGEQVLIRMTDGTECVVAKNDIGDDTRKVVEESKKEWFQPLTSPSTRRPDPFFPRKSQAEQKAKPPIRKKK